MRGTEHSVRAVWRTLDPGLRSDVDDAVSRGAAVDHPALGTVALWRALRLRRQWVTALVFTPLAAAGAVVALVLASGADALSLLRQGSASVALASVVALMVGVPVRRLLVVRRAIAANCDVALSGPQVTDRSSRAASELSRHLALRAAQTRIQGSDSEA